MSAASLLRARAVRERADADGLRSRAASARPPIPLGLSEPGFDVVAEAKLSSPSEGTLRPGGEAAAVDLAERYALGGAAALSVLTEESRFGGAMSHLEAVASISELPVMRKDFLVDPIQVLEARAAGSSGVLLIARLLPGELLVEMTDLTLQLGMFALVEIFDRSDLETAARVFDRDVLVGVNCRDLTSLEVDRERFAALAPHLPDHLSAVAESGVSRTEDAAEVARLGYRAALVGTSLVKDGKPAETLAAMLAAGRSLAATP